MQRTKDVDDPAMSRDPVRLTQGCRTRDAVTDMLFDRGSTLDAAKPDFQPDP
jgi:hypothetical protein